MATWFEFDTGYGFNIIRKSARPSVGEVAVDEKERHWRCSEENGRPLSLTQRLWPTFLISNTPFRVKFVVTERIAVEGIIGTAFLKNEFLVII